MKNDPAIIVVDMLYDFIDGSLACLNAEQAVANTAAFVGRTGCEGDKDLEILDTCPVLFIRDHHPADHCSFSKNGGIWPVHCVQGTRGGEIHEALRCFVDEDLTFDKGCDRNMEQYSGIDGRNAAGQSLGEILEMMDTKNVYVCGIATEYCVRNTCEDLLKAGFTVHVLTDCLAYVDEQGHRKALEEMEAEGMILEQGN
ncbi:MAG: isochorismatase family protein [Bacteroidales bacterium]|nr:isochorismatase family protein [Bacteroidales bacterium]